MRVLGRWLLWGCILAGCALGCGKDTGPFAAAAADLESARKDAREAGVPLSRTDVDARLGDSALYAKARAAFDDAAEAVGEGWVLPRDRRLYSKEELPRVEAALGRFRVAEGLLKRALATGPWASSPGAGPALRRIVRIYVAEARLAVAKHDPPGFAECLGAIIELAEHVAQQPGVTAQTTGYDIVNEAFRLTESILGVTNGDPALAKAALGQLSRPMMPLDLRRGYATLPLESLDTLRKNPISAGIQANVASWELPNGSSVPDKAQAAIDEFGGMSQDLAARAMEARHWRFWLSVYGGLARAKTFEEQAQAYDMAVKELETDAQTNPLSLIYLASWLPTNPLTLEYVAQLEDQRVASIMGVKILAEGRRKASDTELSQLKARGLACEEQDGGFVIQRNLDPNADPFTSVDPTLFAFPERRRVSFVRQALTPR
ncbi:MAG: hypothetical protein U0S12_06115 [Fimbriimonadales bacterium]